MKKVVVILGITALAVAACSKAKEESKSKENISPVAAKTVSANEVKQVKFHGGMQTSSTPSGSAAPKKPLFHGDIKTSATAVPPDSPILQALKQNHLQLDSKKTIGDIFDGYKFAAKKEWRETPTPNGPFFIDYICWFDVGRLSLASLKDGVTKRGLIIKFAIQKDGETYVAMSSRIDVKRDGKPVTTNLYPPDTEKYVKAIYENREITF